MKRGFTNPRKLRAVGIGSVELILVEEDIMGLDSEQEKQYEEMCRVKDLVADDFLKRSDVTGVGVGLKEISGKLTDELAIIISVKKKKDVPAEIAIPDQIKGFITDVIELNPTIGPETSPAEHEEQKGMPEFDPDTYRYDPVGGGMSFGSARRKSSGTLGLVVHQQITEIPMLLSNFHVMCDFKNRFNLGDKMCQPSRKYDSNYRNNICGRLVLWYFEEDYKGKGGIDCAIARRKNRDVFEGNIVEFGQTCGAKKPDQTDIGYPVIKRGYKTGLTIGKIKSINYDTKIKQKTLKKQILVNPIRKEDPFGSPGDSGAVVVLESSREVIGLLCGGSENVGYGIANRIDAVIDALDIEIPESENCD